MRPACDPPAPAISDLAIEVEDLAIFYRLRRDRPTLFSLFRSFLSRGGSVRQIPALRGVSFSVDRGATLGVIGVNGAGKSTLLRAIAGILPPSRGRVAVRGNITPLLTLGVGFNAELTGRDNVTLGALATGLDASEASEKAQEIISFSELGEFIDYPVRSYSTGMRARLGFAVAAHIDSDILLIDETLSVGDVRFQQKCEEKLDEMCGAGRTVVIVTHGVGTTLKMASDCLWLHEGRVMRHGPPKDTVEAYMRFLRVRRVGGGEGGLG